MLFLFVCFCCLLFLFVCCRPNQNYLFIERETCSNLTYIQLFSVLFFFLFLFHGILFLFISFTLFVVFDFDKNSRLEQVDKLINLKTKLKNILSSHIKEVQKEVDDIKTAGSTWDYL